MDAPDGDAPLPPCAELSTQHAAFLDAHFASREDLSSAADLSSELDRRCADLDGDLAALRGRIARLAVSWIYRSLGTKSLIQKSLVKLENLSVCTSQYGVQSNRSRRTFSEELPWLVKEVQRMENIREYVGTALQLEVLVGDLEDSVFFVNHQARNVLSGKISTSSVLLETGRSREKLLHAIKTMNNIEDVVIDILKSRPQWGHLLKSVDSRADRTLAVLRPKVIADHRSLLASLGWPPKLLPTAMGDGEVTSIPNPLVLMQGAKRENFAHSFLSLCALQHLQTRREERKQKLLGLEEKQSRLWAIDELVSPIGARMEYHFTKWIQQPELIFALAFKVTRDFLVGVEDVLQPLIDKARLVAFSAREAWVFSMVLMLSGFLVKKVLPPLAESYREKGGKSEVSTSWLNIMDLIIAFDSRMQSLVQSETCLYVGSDIVQCLTRGVSVLNIFCEKPEWLKIWAKIEFKDAWKKFKVELRDERAWVQSSKCGNGFYHEIESVDYLLATQDDHKAPLIADFVLKVAWAMIERCEKFPSLLPRVQFIRSTAGKFIWCFLKVLISHCRIEELQSASFDDNDVIMRVCGSINAASYVEYKLVEWSDDVNFLDMCFADGMERHENVDTGYNCFFGEEIKSLAELETNWLMEMIAFLLQQFEMLSWDYVDNRHSFGFEQLEQVNTPSVVSTDLVIALDALGSQLTSIRRILNPKDFMDMWRNIADGLDHFLFRSMLASDICFSRKGIVQFTADMRALYLVFQPFCARPEAFFPCIRDSLRLLNMNKEEVKHLQMALSNNVKQIECLHVCGISHLSVGQVHELLRSVMCKL
ncbi:RINT1-like protein MAG2L [Rhodamnia argentea]|uniref:RINT1-like protein MAG2L n=1 Tax=Rhodamnia argentea TaxID=178133 RepID=A0A8B8NJQ8_9MYRT|nr:RINT1-like protein MAG2L [Rhodamnia argentea]